MTFLKTQRSKFIAWMFIYALGVTLMFSKGGDEGTGFVWGLGLGVGAAIATSVTGPAGRWRRLGIVILWFLGGCVLGMVVLTPEFDQRKGFVEWALEMAVGTLIPAFPALLALLIWIFRRSKTDGAAAAAPTS